MTPLDTIVTWIRQTYIAGSLPRPVFDAAEEVIIRLAKGERLMQPPTPAPPSLTGQIVQAGDLGPRLTGVMIRIDRDDLRAFMPNLFSSEVTVTPTGKQPRTQEPHP